MKTLARGYGTDTGVLDLVLRTLVRGATYRVLFGLPVALVVVIGLVAVVALLSARRRRTGARRP